MKKFVLLTICALLLSTLWYANPYVLANEGFNNKPSITSNNSLPRWGNLTLKGKANLVAQNSGGGSKPTSIQFVKTTRQKAVNFMSNSTVDSNEPVYLVLIKGKFIDYNASIPLGASYPTGNNILFTINISNGNIEDFQINNLSYDLERLGIVQTVNP